MRGRPRRAAARRGRHRRTWRRSGRHGHAPPRPRRDPLASRTPAEESSAWEASRIRFPKWSREHVGDERIGLAGAREARARAVHRQRLARRGECALPGQCGGHRREDVAAVEGRGYRSKALGERPMSTASINPPRRSAASIKRPLSGPRADAPPRRCAVPPPAAPPFDGADRRDRRPPDARPRECTASASRKHERRCARRGGDLVGQVDHARRGAAAGDDAVADPHELVAVAIVREEADDASVQRSRPAASERSDSMRPSMSWRSASTWGSSPFSRSVSEVSGPIETMRVAAEMP